ncbi:MAG: hypothetical protein EBV86_12720 [Marivivens sp.]|nr:hypothetical protein [Marivivens sp.]
MTSFNKNGRILYEGPSVLDGKPIVVIAVGFTQRSKNDKTGGMIQTYILRQDVHPVLAFRGDDQQSVCGSCPHYLNKTCYVNWGQGPASVWKCYQRGGYAPIGNEWSLFNGAVVRFGSAGDPCAAPEHVWQPVLERSARRTGYTHQWREPHGQWAKGLLQASCDSPEEYQTAINSGWKPFFVLPVGYSIPAGAVHCAASAERGKKTTCEKCCLCDGSKAPVVIHGHGRAKKRIQFAN